MRLPRKLAPSLGTTLPVLRNWGAPILISIYFLSLSWSALYFYFSPDDSMNLYQAWIQNLQEIVRANLLFFRPSLYPRPFASAVFRIYFAIAGFHVTPLRALNLALLTANLFLAYAVTRRLTRSRTAAALTILLLAYHGRAKALYLDTAFLFDVLSFTFFFLAVTVYLRARASGRIPGWKSILASCLCFICSINSKEIGATLPAILLIYELLYHGTTGWRSIARWFTILAMGAIDLLWIVGKLLAPGSLLHEPGYEPSFTLHRFFETTSGFAGELLLRPSHTMPAAAIAVVWISMLAVARIAKSRALLFAWFFLMFSALPLAFTNPRGLTQYYLPMFGWALYAGVLLELIFSFTLRRLRFSNPIRARIYAGAGLISSLVIVLLVFWKNHETGPAPTVAIEGERNRNIVRQLHHLHPQLKHGAKLLFLDDPMNPEWWNMTFLTALSYKDRELLPDRVKRMGRIPSPAEMAAYDHVLTFRGGYFYDLNPPWTFTFPPAIVIEDGQPQIFHGGGITVTKEHPAHPGEVVLVKVIDLRSPETGIGTASGIDVRVERIAAGILDLRPWGDDADAYRLAVQVPPETPRGLAWIDVTRSGVTGPAVEFAVR